MELNDIKTSISDMSDEDLIVFITKLRTSRATPKEAEKKKKSTPTKKEKSLSSLLGNLSPEQIAEVLAALEEDDNA